MERMINSFLKNEKRVVVTLILISLLFYLRTLWYDFSPMDDQWLILKNASFFGNWQNLKAIFSEPTVGLYYRPLLILTFMIDYHISHLSPLAYHFTNILLHIISVVLLYRLLILLDINQKKSFFGCVIFSIHPLMLHAVAWIPGRNDLLLCVFVLAAFIHLLKYLKTDNLLYLFLNNLFFVCALFTKENAIVLPLLFAFIYYYNTNRKLNEKILPVILWGTITFLWNILRLNIVTSDFPFNGEFLPKSIKLFEAFLLYLGKAVIPTQLSVFPTLNNSSVYPGILILVLLVLIAFRLKIQHKKNALFGLLVFFGILIIPVWYGVNSSFGEHYEQRAYTSMAGVVLFISALNINDRSKLFNYGVVSVIILYGMLSFNRMGIYKTQISFLESGIQSQPGYYLFYIQKGNYFYDRKDYGAAIPFYNKGIELRSNLPEALNARGVCYSMTGNNNEAVKDFTEAIKISKFDPDMYLNRCISYNDLNEVEKAMKDLLVLKECCVNMIPAELNENVTKKWLKLSILKIDQQLLAKHEAVLYYYRAKLYLEMGAKDKALTDLQQACELEPKNIEYKKALKYLLNS